LQHALKDLVKAYKNFFAKHADFPRFKRKGCGDSFSYPDPKQIKLDQVNSRLFLPKLGWLRYRNSRDVLGELRNVTVSSNGGKWFVSIQTQREVADPLHPSGSIIGIGVGIARFATRQTQARFACVEYAECGYENNADLDGAINVLERGHRLLACGELAQSGRSVKQEPADVSQLAFC
jgi:putative transposase